MLPEEMCIGRFRIKLLVNKAKACFYASTELRKLKTTESVMVLYIGSELENCPPSYAKPANGTYYRLMDSGRVEPRNFLSQIKLGYGDKNNCGAYALSLSMSISAALQVKKRFPKKYKIAKIATLELRKEHGLIHQDKPDHANWWHPFSFAPASVASLTEEG